MQSMTGYGREQIVRDGREMTVELKSVNHRFLDISLRMPRHLSFAEDDVRRQLGAAMKRGHVDAFITYRNSRPDARRVSVDPALAAAYRDAMAELSEATGVVNDMPLYRYALTRMRSREGEALKADLTVHLKLLESLRQRILARAPGVVEDYRQRLTQRIAELGATEIDSSRVVQEVAIFADRAAIDEELSRLDSHIHQAYLLMDGEAECGSKLNFLVQEMNREVNTIGSKALDAEIARLVVEAKSEIEKLREQIQNVE